MARKRADAKDPDAETRSARAAPAHHTRESRRVPSQDDLVTRADAMALQRLVGNRTAAAAMAGRVGDATASRPRVQRLSAFKVKMGLQADEKYWPIYKKWFEAHGSEAVEKILEPLETLDELRGILDEFSKSSAMTKSEAEMKREGLVRDYGDKPVFQALIAGIDPSATPKVQLDRLLDNFRAAGATHFDYTMSATDKTKFLSGTVGGDCNTVVRTFEWIATDYLGVAATYKTSADVGFATRFTAPRCRTIDGKTGNVDGGDFWLFDNHYWIEAGGEQYDVLFGKKGVDTSGWVKETGVKDNPSTFGDTKIWATGKVTPLGDRYTTTPI